MSLCARCDVNERKEIEFAAFVQTATERMRATEQRQGRREQEQDARDERARCFMCERLREAAVAAEVKATKAIEAKNAAELKLPASDFRRSEMKRALDTAALAVLRALYAPPFLVVPHVAPKQRGTTQSIEGGRFALLEIT